MLVKEDKVTNQSDLPYRGDWFLQKRTENIGYNSDVVKDTQNIFKKYCRCSRGEDER